jgi:hypothetical protein
MSDMLTLNATDKEREQFRVRMLETHVTELELMVAALLSGRVSDDEIDGWLHGVKLLETDFTPNLAYAKGRGKQIADNVKKKA